MVPRIASLFVALILGACTKTPVPTAVPHVPLAQKDQDQPSEEHKKQPRLRLIAPPPAYGNRVVSIEGLLPPADPATYDTLVCETPSSG